MHTYSQILRILIVVCCGGGSVSIVKDITNFLMIFYLESTFAFVKLRAPKDTGHKVFKIYFKKLVEIL